MLDLRILKNNLFIVLLLFVLNVEINNIIITLVIKPGLPIWVEPKPS